MHVTLFGVILFLHITAAIAGFMIAGVLHAALQALARANTVAEVRFWGRLMHRLDPLFPIVALLLLGFGAWLIHLSEGGISWSEGWIITSVAALVVIEGLMGAIVAPKSKAGVKAIEEASDGPVPDDVRRFARNPLLWHLSHVATLAFTGVVFLMAVQPNGAISVIIVVIGAIVGLALSVAQLRSLPGAPAMPSQRATAGDATAAAS
jgi:hypothetical protein